MWYVFNALKLWKNSSTSHWTFFSLQKLFETNVYIQALKVRKMKNGCCFWCSTRPTNWQPIYARITSFLPLWSVGTSYLFGLNDKDRTHNTLNYRRALGQNLSSGGLSTFVCTRFNSILQCTVAKVGTVIDFPQYNMKFSVENVIIHGIFHVV